MRRAVPFAMLLGVMCSPSAFAPSSAVDTLRALAVQADKPFAAPGENVQLSALVVDPLGNGRPIQFAFGTCLNPGSGEIPECVARLGPMRTMPVTDFSTDFAVTVPADALAGAKIPIGTVGVVFAVCAGTFVPQPRAFGAPIGCVDEKGVVVSRDGFMWGMKRITVIDGVRNANPSIVETKIDVSRNPWEEASNIPIKPCPPGDVASCPSSLKHAIDVTIDPRSIESYPDPLDLRQTRTEDVVLFFFASQGAFRDDVARPLDTDAGPPRTFATVWAPVAVDPARPVEFWFVLRDDRGGTSFVHRSATILP